MSSVKPWDSENVFSVALLSETVADCNLLQHTPFSIIPDLPKDVITALQEADTGVISDISSVFTPEVRVKFSLLQAVDIRIYTPVVAARYCHILFFCLLYTSPSPRDR